MKLLEAVLSKRKALWWVVFGAYCGFVVWMTLLKRVPTERQYELGLFWGFRLCIENDPRGRGVIIQYINNILFFIPLGFLLNGIVSNWKRVALIGFGTSAAIELTQFVTARGLAEIDDVISNTAGALLGCMILIGGKKMIARYINVR